MIILSSYWEHPDIKYCGENSHNDLAVIGYITAKSLCVFSPL